MDSEADTMDEQPPSDRGRAPDTNLARALGRTIKVLRTDQGIGRRDLATRAGISYSYLTEIENGRKPPSNSVLSPIADALHVRLHELIADAEDRLATMGDELESSMDSSPIAPPASLASTRLPAPWLQMSGGDPSTPSARRSRALDSWPMPSSADSESAPRHHMQRVAGHRRDSSRSSSNDELYELNDLYRRLSPDDRQRVLDLIRRLLG
jgi:transcriptional regulator with XRE-family HTH domain